MLLNVLPPQWSLVIAATSSYLPSDHAHGMVDRITIDPGSERPTPEEARNLEKG